jgi:peroxiredoxin
MAAVKDDGNPIKKQFELTLIASDASIAGAEADAERQTFLWALEETGRGSWLWLDHVGAWQISPLVRDDGQSGPSLLYVRADGKSVVPLPAPLFARDGPISEDAAWHEGRLEYRVHGEKKIADRTCWEIEVRSPFGHKRTIFRAKETPLVVAVRETVFIGQGEQHDLVLELVETKQLEAEDLKTIEQAFTEALELRSALERPARSDRGELNDAQLALLRKGLPAVVKTAAKTPLAPILAAAQEDLQSQRGRSAAAAALRDQVLGKSAGVFKLTDLTGKEVTQKTLEGKVTVLHFWPYRDTPLEEPYGQVGYLDFLVRKRAKEPVQVIGVTIDERAADETQRRSVTAAARKFRDFMNVGYPIVLDDGSFLKRFGDPRNAGGKLPVFVVIGKDGKVIEYHAGMYDVTPQEGLAELDRIIGQALKP